MPLAPLPLRPLPLPLRLRPVVALLPVAFAWPIALRAPNFVLLYSRRSRDLIAATHVRYLPAVAADETA